MSQLIVGGGEGCRRHFCILSSTSDLSPLDGSSPPECANENRLQTLADVPWGSREGMPSHPQLRTIITSDCTQAVDGSVVHFRWKGNIET